MSMGGLGPDLRRLVAREFAAPGDQEDVAGSLQRLCRTAARSLPASGVGVSVLTREGALVTTAASDQASSAIEELQFALGEGPCMEAYATRRPVLAGDLAAERTHRWPGYAPSAQALGVGAVFAFPLQVGAARLGVMDVYRRESGQLSTPTLKQALDFATVAVDLLLDAQQRSATDGTAPSVDDVLGTGYELYQAQGMVMIQAGVPLDEAMARLRAYAFAEGRGLHDVAADVVARRLVLESDDPQDDPDSPSCKGN